MKQIMVHHSPGCGCGNCTDKETGKQYPVLVCTFEPGELVAGTQQLITDTKIKFGSLGGFTDARIQ